MDHLIHALVKNMLPSYEDRHKWQMLGMQGPNLAEKRWKEILAHAPKIPLEQIKDVGQSHFKVRSTSLEKIYEVNLLTYTCTCKDFPCIQLCKHITSTVHFFGGLEGELGPCAPENTSERELDMSESPAQQDGSTGNAKSRSSVISILNDILCLSYDFLEMGPVDLDMVKSLQMARSQLNAA